MTNLIKAFCFLSTVIFCTSCDSEELDELECNSETPVTAIIIKDCTGNYLRFEDGDYFVCNGENLDVFDQLDEISVIIESNDNCLNTYGSACELFHITVGELNILEIQ